MQSMSKKTNTTSGGGAVAVVSLAIGTSDDTQPNKTEQDRTQNRTEEIAQ